MRRTAVLGAGPLGLVAALRLAQSGDRVSVIEREPQPGGLAAGFEPFPGVWLEKFYHHIFRSDTHAIRLIREVGLDDRLAWESPVTATLSGGRAHRLDSPASLMRFGPLPVIDRLRMGAALAVLKGMPDPRLLEGQTAAGWMRRWMGARAYDVVWAPLMRGKFGDAASEIAMPWFWARVHDRTRQLGYLRGGFQQLYGRLAQAVQGAGGEVRLSCEVTAVQTDGHGFLVESHDGGERFDRVISTLAPRLTARLVPQLPAEWRKRHEWGRALGAHCLVLALDRPLTAGYWLNVNDPGFPFMVLAEHTNFMPASDYNGNHMVYLGNYLPMDDPLMTASKETVLEQFLPHLQRMNASFERSWVADSWIFSAPYAQPLVTVDYRSHIPPFATPLDDLWLASMFQVYPHDRGQNYSIALAERLARRIGP